MTDLEKFEERIRQVEDRINYFENLTEGYARTFDLLDRRIDDIKKKVETLEDKH